LGSEAKEERTCPKSRLAAAEAEATARAINAEPWEPLAGLVKRLCPQCRYFFASPVDSPERRCANCASLGTGAARTRTLP